MNTIERKNIRDEHARAQHTRTKLRFMQHCSCSDGRAVQGVGGDHAVAGTLRSVRIPGRVAFRSPARRRRSTATRSIAIGGAVWRREVRVLLLHWQFGREDDGVAESLSGTHQGRGGVTP